MAVYPHDLPKKKKGCHEHGVEQNNRGNEGRLLTENDAAVGLVYTPWHLVISSRTLAPSCARIIIIAPIFRMMLLPLPLPMPILFLLPLRQSMSFPLPLRFSMVLLAQSQSQTSPIFLLLFIFSSSGRRNSSSGSSSSSTKDPAVRHERAPTMFSPIRARLGRSLRSD
jgi:hypothetical protein